MWLLCVRVCVCLYFVAATFSTPKASTSPSPCRGIWIVSNWFLIWIAWCDRFWVFVFDFFFLLLTVRDHHWLIVQYKYTRVSSFSKPRHAQPRGGVEEAKVRSKISEEKSSFPYDQVCVFVRACMCIDHPRRWKPSRRCLATLLCPEAFSVVCFFSLLFAVLCSSESDCAPEKRKKCEAKKNQKQQKVTRKIFFSCVRSCGIKSKKSIGKIRWRKYFPSRSDTRKDTKESAFLGPGFPFPSGWGVQKLIGMHYWISWNINRRWSEQQTRHIFQPLLQRSDGLEVSSTS